MFRVKIRKYLKSQEHLGNQKKKHKIKNLS